MNWKINLTSLLLLILVICAASAQSYDSTRLLNNKLYVGSAIGGVFGDHSSVLIRPFITAQLNSKVSTGAGIEYRHTDDTRYSQMYNQFGICAFGQYNIVSKIYAHFELAGYSMQRFTTSFKKERNLVPVIYIGGGYRRSVSNCIYLNCQILFDALRHRNSPYGRNPVLSLGFGVNI